MGGKNPVLTVAQVPFNELRPGDRVLSIEQATGGRIRGIISMLSEKDGRNYVSFAWETGKESPNFKHEDLIYVPFLGNNIRDN